MRFDNPFTEADIFRADEVPDTPGMVVKATFHGIRAWVTFGQRYVNPVLAGQTALHEREDAIVILYRRIFAFLASLAVLDLPLDTQAIASLTRSVFELFVDFKSVHLDIYPDAAHKFRHFTLAERLRIARKTIEFDDHYPGVLLRTPDIERHFIETNGAKIEAEALELWGTSNPRHWSGTSHLQVRTRAVGVENLYIAHYSQLSAFVHSGAAGFHGLGLDSFAALVSICHILAVQRGVETLEILADELGLTAHIEKLPDKLQFLNSVQGLLLTDLKLMSLGESQRLFLELHWANQRRGKAPDPANGES